MISTTETAVDFFIQKILDRARIDNITFSKAQAYVLSLNVLDERSYLEQDIINAFEEESSARQFENNVMGLISRAYQHDAEVNSPLLADYREAHRTLRAGKFYLYYMVDKAIGNNLDRIGTLFTAQRVIIYLFIAFINSIYILDKNPISYAPFFIITLICILAAGLSTGKYSELIRRSMYNAYFRRHVHIKEYSLLKDALITVALCITVVLLIKVSIPHLMGLAERKEYLALTFEAGILILYGAKAVLSAHFVILMLKIRVLQRKRGY